MTNVGKTKNSAAQLALVSTRPGRTSVPVQKDTSSKGKVVRVSVMVVDVAHVYNIRLPMLLEVKPILDVVYKLLLSQIEDINIRHAHIYILLVTLFVVTDIDECWKNKKLCGPIGTCVNTPGSYKCTCPKGYKFQGKSCKGECNGS